jgi:hypothetical protein
MCRAHVELLQTSQTVWLLEEGKLGTTHSHPISTTRACVSTPLHLVHTSNQNSHPAELASREAQAAAMSLAPSLPSIKVKVGIAVIRGSKAEVPIRKPAAPPPSRPPKTPALSAPPSLSQPPKPDAPPPPSSPPEPKPVDAVQRPVAAGAVTLEYQRKVAKELQDYFKQKKLEEADQGPFFGFLPKNEISNGRYVCPAARCINFCEQRYIFKHALPSNQRIQRRIPKSQKVS